MTSFASALLRTIVGGLFIGHGLQKLAGWFGGHGPEGTGQFFDSLGLKPGRRNAVAAGVAETAGGALVALGRGRLTTLGAAALTGTMVTAIRHVHAPKGPWNTDGGYEYNLVLLAAVAAITDRSAGPAAAAGQLAAGTLGSLALTELARREAQAEETAAPQTAPETADREARFTREGQAAPAS